MFDEISAKFISQCGGNSGYHSDGKQAEAFDMNIVDSSAASVATVKKKKLRRKIGTITKIGHSENLFLVIVNENTFQDPFTEGPGAGPRGGPQGRGQRLGEIPGF